MERLNRVLTVIAWRLAVFCVFVIILSFTYPITSQWMPEREAILEISGFAPQEEVVLERFSWWQEFMVAADARGIATFKNIPFGKWRVVKGGSEELRKFIIPVDEYRGNFSYGPVRVEIQKMVKIPEGSS